MQVVILKDFAAKSIVVRASIEVALLNRLLPDTQGMPQIMLGAAGVISPCLLCLHN